MKKTALLLTLAVLIASVLALFTSCNPKGSFKINGIAIEDYTIVYSDDDGDYALRAAEYIKKALSSFGGAEIEILEDDAAPREYEIVVGDSSRAISERIEAETDGLEFAIRTEEKSIALEGDYFVIAAAAYFFVETYINNKNEDKTVPLGEYVHNPIVKEAKNYIMLIGDGMGTAHTTLPEYLDNDKSFGDGEDFFYGYLLPNSGYAVTRSLTGITDSAAAATALATGYKTENGIVGQNPSGEELKSITELALSLGMSAGIMSTDAATGATPAAFSAHTNHRNNDDEIKADQSVFVNNGGILNCNYNMYNASGVKYIGNTVADTLAKLGKNDKGFFLMYEEAHIDKNASAGDLDKTYESVLRFNHVIGRVMEYTFYNPETFVLITADHETGGLTKGEDDSFSLTTTEHTSANVPIFAYGKGSELFNGKTIENIQIPSTIASLWGILDFGDQSEFEALK